MIALKKIPTAIFGQLLNRMEGQERCELAAPSLWPLVIQRHPRTISTDRGTATRYSLYHYRTAGGKRLHDPLMCFLVIDQRRHSRDWAHLHIYAQMLQQDHDDIQEESIVIEHFEVTHTIPIWQKGHAVFASRWLLEIGQQGYLR